MVEAVDEVDPVPEDEGHHDVGGEHEKAEGVVGAEVDEEGAAQGALAEAGSELAGEFYGHGQEGEEAAEGVEDEDFRLEDEAGEGGEGDDGDEVEEAGEADLGGGELAALRGDGFALVLGVRGIGGGDGGDVEQAGIAPRAGGEVVVVGKGAGGAGFHAPGGGRETE